MIKMPKIELNNFLAQRYYFAAQANKLHHVKEGLAGARDSDNREVFCRCRGTGLRANGRWELSFTDSGAADF